MCVMAQTWMKMGRYFHFVKTGKVGEFYSIYWKNRKFNQFKNLGEMRVFISYWSTNIFSLGAWHAHLYAVLDIAALQ